MTDTVWWLVENGTVNLAQPVSDVKDGPWGIFALVPSPRPVDRDHVKRDARDYARDLLAAKTDDEFATALRGLGYCAGEWE